MTTLTGPHPARADKVGSIAGQTRAYLDRILAADTTEPSAALLQCDQALMLKTMHGGDVVAWVYAAWLRDYHRAALPGVRPLTAWDDLCLAMAPIPRWNRDIHGFLCVGGCDDCFAQVAESDGFGWCGPCARRLLEAEPSEVRPLPFPAAHHHLVHRGLLPEERAHFRAAELRARLTNDTTVTYIAGDAAAFDHPAWMGMAPANVQLTGEPDRPVMKLAARTVQDGHCFDIHADLHYDPAPDASRPYGYPTQPYGFRLSGATLTDSRGNITTHADLYELLDAIVRGEPEHGPDVRPGASAAAVVPAITDAKENTVPDPDIHTSTPPDDHTPVNAEQLPTSSGPVALTELTRLAVQLSRRTGLRSLMLAIQPPQPGLAAGPAAVDVVGCQPAPVVRLQEDLLYADPGSTAGQAAAGALAHHLVCRATPVPRAAIGARYAIASLYPVLLVAVVLAWPAWTFAVMLAVAVAAIVLRAVVMHVREFTVDEQAAGWLSEHGLDGDTCIRVMLGQLAAAETRIRRIRAWVEAGRPTATTRARALAHARRRADELQ